MKEINEGFVQYLSIKILCSMNAQKYQSTLPFTQHLPIFHSEKIDNFQYNEYNTQFHHFIREKEKFY